MNVGSEFTFHVHVSRFQKDFHGTHAPRTHYLNADYGIRSWLLTIDHKRIALLYLGSITVMFLLGGVFAGLIRLELLTPAGDLVEADTYNKLFTMHGIIMIFFFLIPSIPAVLGNFLIPMMIGARDLAFPRLNLLSWYIYIVGALFTFWAMLIGGVDTGWTFYTPFSTMASNTNVIPTALGIFITGFSSILTGLNFIVTIHRMRAPGLTWFRLPLFVWAHYATSLIMILGTPVLAITILLVGARARLPPRHLRSGARRRSAALPASVLVLLAPGGVHHDPARHGRDQRDHRLLLAQAHLRLQLHRHLQPGDCAARLPGLGASHVRHRAVGVRGMIFSFLSFAVAIPSAVKVFNWTATLYKGSVSFQAPMLYALGFIGLFTIGGLTGLFLATLGARRARARHLLRRRALPLHHGRRRGHGVPRRHALLVAEDHRPDVSGGVGEGRRGDRLPRLQPDVLPAVRARLSGHAAALPRLSAGVSGAERDVDGGGVDPRRSATCCRWST